MFLWDKAVELSVFMGVGGWGCLSFSSKYLIGITSCALKKSTTVLAFVLVDRMVFVGKREEN